VHRGVHRLFSTGRHNFPGAGGGGSKTGYLPRKHHTTTYFPQPRQGEGQELPLALPADAYECAKDLLRL